MKLLKALGDLGEDPLLEELIFHLQRVGDGIEIVAEKIDNVSSDAQAEKQIDKLGNLHDEMYKMSANSVDNFAEVSDLVRNVVSSLDVLPGLLIKLQPKDLDLSSVTRGLGEVKGALAPLANATYWVKISDRLGSIQQIMERQEKKETQEDRLSSSDMKAMFEDLKGFFGENNDKMIKANRETITVVGGGGLSGGYLANTMRSLTTVPPTTAAVTTAASVVAAVNTKRKRIIFQNTGTTIIKINLAAIDPSATVYTVALSACTSANDGTGGTFIEEMYQGECRAISSGSGGTLNITQVI